MQIIHNLKVFFGFLVCLPSTNGALEEKHVPFDDPDLGFVDRMYLQYLPSNYQDQDSFPLVIDFHGFSTTADEHRLYSKWDVLAEEKGFIAVFPEGVPDSPSGLGWEARRA
jgi:poly(3-hydroxybutyrate) depolymerase